MNLEDAPTFTTLAEYEALERRLKTLTHRQVMNVFWVLARTDLYFLLRYVLSTKAYFKDDNGIIHPQWILDRCREVQSNSHKVIDIWARFHWKSNIKTFANVIRHILLDPDVTVLILSHTRPSAKKFLAQIQRELLTNKLLQRLSYDERIKGPILPDKMHEYTKNSLDDGIIVNRPGNPKEGTIEAAGLVDSLPQGPHFKIRAIDDAVTPASVTTLEQKEKTLAMWELSQPLGMPGGRGEEWITGTFYSYDDCYHSMMNRGYELRLHPCFAIDWDETKKDDKGKIVNLAHRMDEPVLYNEERLNALIEDMGGSEGSKNAAMQMFCDPSAGTSTGFDLDWLQTYKKDPEEERYGKNFIMLMDPASEKKEARWRTTYTSIWVIGLGADGNYYAMDAVRDRMGLSERADAILRLHRKWRPRDVRIETFGQTADVEYLQERMSRENYRFRITAVKGSQSKIDRIQALEPSFRSGQWYFPKKLWYHTVGREQIDLMGIFREEYAAFPNSSYIDMLDALARILDTIGYVNGVRKELRLVWPRADMDLPVDRYRARHKKPTSSNSWMAA